MQKEQIFEKMNGFLAEGSHSLPEQADIEDEFAEGKECCLLYEGVETILNGMERITKLLAMKMYEYGRCGSGARFFGQ